MISECGIRGSPAWTPTGRQLVALALEAAGSVLHLAPCCLPLWRLHLPGGNLSLNQINRKAKKQKEEKGKRKRKYEYKTEKLSKQKKIIENQR